MPEENKQVKKPFKGVSYLNLNLNFFKRLKFFGLLICQMIC